MKKNEYYKKMKPKKNPIRIFLKKVTDLENFYLEYEEEFEDIINAGDEEFMMLIGALNDYTAHLANHEIIEYKLKKWKVI